MYGICHERKRYRTIRDELITGLSRLFQKSDVTRESFWALKDVSFEIEPGEAVGIIGRNGAGKSTLLKILARVTSPTTGQAILRGRAASLLEVGTGFHPELTGRENIFVAGILLGMTRREVNAKFDEIVDFAGVEKFLDTPVKRYSSGMQVRLAFSVAAHLDVEIMLMDEVLAVGDAQFQKKCMGKMEEVVSRSGRTILFVSHQMAAIQNLCSRAVLLDEGRVRASGDTNAVIQEYIQSSGRQGDESGSSSLENRADRHGNGDLRFVSISSTNADGQPVTGFPCGEDGILELKFENRTGGMLKNLQLSVGIDTQFGDRIAHIDSDIINRSWSQLPPNADRFILRLRNVPLVPGRYWVTLFCRHNGAIADWIQSAGWFDVESGDFYGTGKLPEPGQGRMLISYDIGAK